MGGLIKAGKKRETAENAVISLISYISWGGGA